MNLSIKDSRSIEELTNLFLLHRRVASAAPGVREVDYIKRFLSRSPSLSCFPSPPLLTGAISARAWPLLLKYIEEITSGTRTLNLTPEILRRCRSLLARIRPIRKQLGIDGLKNMWILKPPSSSRGRGIAISQVWVTKALGNIFKILSTREQFSETSW